MYNIDKLTTNPSKRINNYADYAKLWCNKFIDTFPTSLLTPFANFSPFYEWFEDESKLIKDKRKHNGAVDKRSSEQQFCKSGVITFVV